ncbi:MAG: hypothetical protein LAO79_19935, partial [Acidobacteriia bacterium]|nr:hypothetical protein [Terriglobia bacterium]
NQTFCDSQVQLAPQQFFSNVYIPTAAELAGNFPAFTGLLVNPATNQPYSGGAIPSNQLGTVFAWRIGPAQARGTPGGWSSAGSMTAARSLHSSILLPSGKVLIVGPLRSVETFDPATGTFAQAGSLVTAHCGLNSAVLLNDGRVLVAGGPCAPTTAEIYDPETQKSTLTGSTSDPHGSAGTATLLSDGRVLVVGGLTGSSDPSTGAEIYDPATGKFTKAGPMTWNRNRHSATLLPDGRVLVAGGIHVLGGEQDPTPTFGTAEIFDPKTGNFTLAAPLVTERLNHYAILLSNGKVLLGGGYGPGPSSAELFDPLTNRFSPTGDMNEPRQEGMTASLLSNGQVLVAAGTISQPTSTSTAELYNPATGKFTLTGNLSTSRQSHAASVLNDGRVLITGGTRVCPPCNPAIASAELYTPVTQGIITSQSGLTFRVAQGNTTAPSQSVTVLSSIDTIPWTLSTKTFQGGGWLTATPSGNVSDPAKAPVTIAINVNPAGLAAQDYYGSVTLSPSDGKHPPVTIAIVLSIVPAGAAEPPSVLPGGLVFLTPANTAGTPQSFVISNLTSKQLAFAGTAAGSSGWFDFNPKSATIAAGRATTISVTPAAAAFAPGVYRGSIQLAFGDGSSQVVDLLLVVSSGVTPSANFTTPSDFAAAAATPTCTATKLLPVFTTIAAGFNTPAAWPSSVIVQVVDDCGNAVSSGSVVASFSNGDPPLGLISTGGGAWSGTWVPGLATTKMTVRADATHAPLVGSVQVSGQIAKNAGVPVVTPGGIVSTGDFVTGPALGLTIAIFGSGFADAPVQPQTLPLPHQVGSTTVVLGSETLPLLYASDGLIAAVIPYDVPVNASQQLVVTHGNAVSVPVSFGMFDAAPVVLATSGAGTGQAHAYKYDAQGNAILANAADPATAGDPLVIYAIGLGAVSPSVNAGDASPSSPPSTIPGTVTVQIGGVPAKVAFAGLTPTAVGLYQVNVTVPPGITPGAQVPVTISVGAKASSGATFMGIR